MSDKLIKTVKGIRIIQVEPVGTYGIGAAFRLENEAAEIVGRFTLLPAVGDVWIAVADDKSGDQALITSYAESLVGEVNRGETKLEGQR